MNAVSSCKPLSRVVEESSGGGQNGGDSEDLESTKEASTFGRNRAPSVEVLAYQELSSDMSIQPVARVELAPRTERCQSLVRVHSRPTLTPRSPGFFLSVVDGLVGQLDGFSVQVQAAGWMQLPHENGNQFFLGIDDEGRIEESAPIIRSDRAQLR